MEVLAASAAVFWGLIILFTCLLFVSVERENGLEATSLLILSGFVAWIVYDFNVLTYVANNINMMLMWTAAYFVIGAMWGVSKWTFFCLALKKYIIEDPKVKFKTTDQVIYRGKIQSIPPSYKDNKNKFMVWMGYWPASMIWTLINDAVRGAFEWLYNTLGSSMQKISNKIFADVSITEKNK